jgi:hypothetical protein
MTASSYAAAVIEGTITITKAQARVLAETLERAPASARFTVQQRRDGQLVLWDREPDRYNIRIRITAKGICRPRRASAPLWEFESR